MHAKFNCSIINVIIIFEQITTEMDIEGMTACLADYLYFYFDVCALVKTVPCYLNNKPWRTQGVKVIIA